MVFSVVPSEKENLFAEFTTTIKNVSILSMMKCHVTILTTQNVTEEIKKA